MISIVTTVMMFVFFLLFLFLGMGARLLPTWMFVNSLQLIVHTPLLASYMPSSLNYFLIHYLDLERLYSKLLNESVEAWQKSEGINNYDLSNDDTSYFSYRLNDCGYKNEFSRNIIFIGTLLISFLLVLAILYCIDLKNKCKTLYKPDNRKAK